MTLVFGVKKDAFYLESKKNGFENALQKYILKAPQKGMNLREIADFYEITNDFVKKF